MIFRLRTLAFLFVATFSLGVLAGGCEDVGIPKVAENQENELYFRNFSTEKMAGHCWGFAQLHRTLLAGAHFDVSKTRDSDEEIARKLKLLDEGVPVTLNGFRSIREFTREFSMREGDVYEPDGVLREHIERQHRRIYYSPGSYLGTGFAWLSAPGDEGQAKKIVRHLKDGKRPIIGIFNSGSNHAVVAEGYEELLGGGIRIYGVDSNSPSRRTTLDCDSKGKCNFREYPSRDGWDDVRISIVPPFSPDLKNLAKEKCKMLAGQPYFDEESAQKPQHGPRRGGGRRSSNRHY